MSEQENPALVLTAFRDPISQQTMMMTAEDAPVYQEFMAEYVASLQVVGSVELQLAYSIASAQWRLNYIRALQNNMLSLQLAMHANIEIAEPNAQSAAIAAQTQPRKSLSLRELSMYEQRLNKQFHQDLKVLRALQKERRIEAWQNSQAPAPAQEAEAVQAVNQTEPSLHEFHPASPACAESFSHLPDLRPEAGELKDADKSPACNFDHTQHVFNLGDLPNLSEQGTSKPS